MSEAAENPAIEEGAIKEARIVSPKSRSVTVELDWPVEFDGKTWDKIEVRRVTGREVEQFLEAISTRKEGEPRPPLPVIVCPNEVYDAMDDDDRLRVEEAALPFLPRRLTEAAASIQPSSEATSEQ